MYKNILVVDDDPLYLDLVKDLLVMYHHNAVTASNGAEALTQISKGQFDVIVCDIEMPVMNGIAFHSHLINIEGYRNIPFVFLTGTEDLEKVRYIRDHPPAVLVTKAQMIERLVTVISEITAPNATPQRK